MGEAEKKSNQKNLILNVEKLIAAYMVVFIHVSFPGRFGTAIVCLARFAVPFFFIVSGYFSYEKFNQDNIEKIDKKIRTTGLLYLESIGFYLLIVLGVLRNSEQFITWLSAELNYKEIIKWLFFNKFNNIELEHLWFIGALLYCYIFFRFVYRHIKLINILPLLLIINYTFGEGHQMFHLPAFPEYITRNAWFCGIPCFAIGCIIREKEKVCTKYFTRKELLGIVAIAGVLTLGEAYLVGIADLYIFSIVIAVSLFLYSVICPRKQPKRWRGFAEINTGTIYVTHQAIAIYLRVILEKISFKYENVILPILTCFVATIISIAIQLSKERIRKRIKEYEC